MFSQSCVSGFHRISEGVESRRARLSATTPSWRHIWSSTHTKRPSLDHTRNCQPSPNQLSNFNFQQGHRLPPYIRHRFDHPRAQTTPHHSIIHPPQIPVHHPALDKIQISIFLRVTGSHSSPTFTHLHSTPRTLRRQSPISTVHLANLRRPLPDLEVKVSDNIRKI